MNEVREDSGLGQQYVSYRNFINGRIVFYQPAERTILDAFYRYHLQAIQGIRTFAHKYSPSQTYTDVRPKSSDRGDAQSIKHFSHFTRSDVQKAYAAIVIGDVHMAIVKPSSSSKRSIRRKQFVLRRGRGGRRAGRGGRRDGRSGGRDGRSGGWHGAGYRIVARDKLIPLRYAVNDERQSDQRQAANKNFGAQYDSEERIHSKPLLVGQV